ncbi:MAG: TIGR01777 family oxidoreductase [Verrucomicrobiota bacterium]
MSEQKTVLVSGATGLVGRSLCACLQANGHVVRRLSRSSGDISWNPEAGEIDSGSLDGIDVVVHLAGESVDQRWTESAKARILDSRVKSADLLVREILKQNRAIDYISASGISYYGVDLPDALDESMPLGGGFLAKVTQGWEGAADPLRKAGLRCVFLRTGVVLSKEGGALKKLLSPFKAGLGGRVGSGRQIMSWIGLDDLVRIFERCIVDCEIEGPVNAVSPEAVTNAEFTKALGKVLGRPTIFPLPTAIVKTLFGEMGNETILSNLKVIPAKLTALDFQWNFPDIESALRNTLKE